MDFYFENQGINTYLVYAVKPDDIIDSLSLGMLTNNKISGLAQTQFMQMDEKKYFKYNISSRITVEQFFEGYVNRKRLIGVFKGIVNALISAEDYMIDVNSLIIDLEYMFADVSTCETVLICLPIVGGPFAHVDLGLFFKNIMFSTQFDQTDNCDYVAKIINYLNSAAKFSLMEFKDLLDSIESIESANFTPNKKSKSEVNPVSLKKAEGNIQEKQKQYIPPQRGTNTRNNPKNTVVTQTSKQSVSNEDRKDVAAESVKGLVPQEPSRLEVPQRKEKLYDDTTSKEDNPKDISWLYLMQHYNKENAAAYKAQKEARKGGAADKGKSKSQKVSSNKKEKHEAQPANNFGFAIPGQDVSVTSKVSQQASENLEKNENGTMQKTEKLSHQYVSAHPEIKYVQTADFGETTVLGLEDIDVTTVIVPTSESAGINPHLIRVKNNEKILLNKPVFIIGKKDSYVDYCINDNKAISRCHANIIDKNGEYFVLDTNSMNHTYVNGTMIQSNVETKINHGDIIRLANEEFEFKIY